MASECLSRRSVLLAGAVLTLSGLRDAIAGTSAPGSLREFYQVVQSSIDSRTIEEISDSNGVISVLTSQGSRLILRRLTANEEPPTVYVQSEEIKLLWTSINAERLTVARQLITPRMFNAQCDGRICDAIPLNTMLAIAASVGCDVLLTSAVYNIEAPLQLTGGNGIGIYFEPGAWLKIGNVKSVMPHVLNLTGCRHVVIVNAQVDGSGYRGANGIGLGGTTERRNQHCSVKGGFFKRLYRSPVTGGGRAVTMQFDCFSCVASGYIAEDCTTAADVHGSFAHPVSRCSFEGFVAIRCNEVLSVYDLEDHQNYPSRHGATDVHFSNWYAENVGKADSLLSSRRIDATDNGCVILMDRARYPKITNGLVVNDAAYGSIGALIRGTSQGCLIRDTKIVANMDCVFDLRRSNTLLPVDMSRKDGVYSRWFTAQNVIVQGIATLAIRVTEADPPYEILCEQVSHSECHIYNSIIDVSANLVSIRDAV